MSDAARITQQEVLPLPRWARLAFATRCVRRARPLLKAPTDQVRTLEDALARTEEAARSATAGEELADAAAAAYTLALDNLDSKTGTPGGEEDTVVVTCMVAHATAFAAEAATLQEARMAAYLVAQSVDFSVHAFRVAHSANATEAILAMRVDLHRLRETVERRGWTDRSPITPWPFGPL